MTETQKIITNFDESQDPDTKAAAYSNLWPLHNHETSLNKIFHAGTTATSGVFASWGILNFLISILSDNYKIINE
jgi:hypothetical protein